MGGPQPLFFGIKLSLDELEKRLKQSGINIDDANLKSIFLQSQIAHIRVENGQDIRKDKEDNILCSHEVELFAEKLMEHTNNNDGVKAFVDNLMKESKENYEKYQQQRFNIEG